MKLVFDVKPGSGYHDDETGRYHFPIRYLATAREGLGDWVVYREPQRNRGARAYVAVARLAAIEPDPDRDGLHYANVDMFLRFDVPVPFVMGGAYREERLRLVADPKHVGLALRGFAIRSIGEEDFASIVADGLSRTLDPQNVARLHPYSNGAESEMRSLLGSTYVTERRVVEILTNRTVRDAAFRGTVCVAYDDRCAVTGLKMINGGGRAEVQAAHILPVADGGPDVVQNGVALSATAHWLFDRHLITFTDELGLLVAHNRIPTQFLTLFEKQRERIHLPVDRTLWPHPAFVAHHRDRFASKS